MRCLFSRGNTCLAGKSGENRQRNSDSSKALGFSFLYTTHPLHTPELSSLAKRYRFSLPPRQFSVTLGRMKVVRLLLPLAICVPVGAVSGLYALDVNPIRGAIGGAVIGFISGLAFGGVERVVEF